MTRKKWLALPLFALFFPLLLTTPSLGSQLEHSIQSYGMITYPENPNSSYPENPILWNEGLGGGRVPIKWYNWLHDGDGKPNAVCRRIAESRPTIIYTMAYLGGAGWQRGYWGGTLNLTPEIVDLFHQYNVKIFAHIPYTSQKIDPTVPILQLRPLVDPNYGGVLAQMDRDAKLGIDGFKIDDTYNFSPQIHTVDEWRQHEAYAYYKAIYDKAKSLGLTCLMNTGTYYNSEVLMELCDILGLEAGWETFITDSRLAWHKKYDKYRFEGYNDEARVPIGGSPFTVTSGLDLAVKTTLKAWDNGIGYHHCSVNRKTLPDWWEEYLQGIGFG